MDQPLSAGERPAATILVIDDSLTYRAELVEHLGQAGYRVIAADSGELGLRLASQHHPDAVIVDRVMPGLDGTAVIQRIRLDPGLSAIPCLLLTASEGDEAEVLALDSGADTYVRKGDGCEVVLARLGAALRTTRESRERDPAASRGGRRILAVDDSLTYREELALELRGEGYEVLTVRSGEAALDLLAQAREPFDCVLLDLIMPGLSGTETCTRMRRLPALRDVGIIMLTSLEHTDSMIEGMNRGADDFVWKSAGFGVVKARLRAQLRRKQVEDEHRRTREEILHRDAETRAAREVAEARAQLLAELESKNRELESVNQELQSFCHTVSHDLRQPLRSMDGFSQVLLQEYHGQLDDRGRHYLERVRAGAQRMSQLIDGLLILSQVTRQELRRVPLLLDQVASRVLQRLRDSEPRREVDVVISSPLAATGDPQLVESLLENLLGNAWKFTGQRHPARIEVGREPDGSTYYVRDNGAGFSMDYAHRLFAPFQRLHALRDFPGTGIGLATALRIVHRHGGRIWALGEVGGGATFHFTLAPGGRVREDAA